MSKIIRLTVSNLLRIKAAEVKPDGALVIVAGRNDQGKSSLLNSIGLALSGKDVPAQPIRQGCSTGQVILETEELVVTRTFSQSGGGRLEVRDRNNDKLTSPQTKLDALFSLVTFDPLSFTRLDGKAQAETLRKLVGLDFADLDAKLAKVFDQRTLIGRGKAQVEAALAGITRVPDAPDEEEAATALVEEYNAALEANAANNDQREALSDMCDDVDNAEARLDHHRQEVELAQQALKDAEANLERRKATREEARKKVDALQDVDAAAIKVRLDNLEATNKAVRENVKWHDAHKVFVARSAEYDELTGQIEALRAQRLATIGKATFPIDGLEFVEDGVAFEGVPFKQISSSKQIRVSLAIACALNPNLRVMLIRDGSLLDPDSLALVSEYAEEHDAQVFLECVGNRDDATVIIEDGQVIDTPVARKKRLHK